MESFEAMNISQLNKYAEKFCSTREIEELYGYATGVFRDPCYDNRKYLAVFILGEISAESHEAREFLRNDVSLDKDWRTQEVLAKSFNRFCSKIGYEKSMNAIKDWMRDSQPNVRRSAIEGLRIWTNRPFFKDNPELAIQLISHLRGDKSEYVRKSVGNALSDISKKHRQLVAKEIQTWNIDDPLVFFTYKRATRHL